MLANLTGGFSGWFRRRPQIALRLWLTSRPQRSSETRSAGSKRSIRHCGSKNIKVSITGRKGTYAVVPGDEPVGVNVRLGDTSVEEGECGENRFGTGDCSFDDAGHALTCRP